MADGSELPRMQQGETMTMAIRNQSRNHMLKKPAPVVRNSNVQTPLVSFAQVLGPDDVESDYNEQETVSANPALWQHVFAADRVEKPERRMN